MPTSKEFLVFVVFFSSRRRHTRFDCDWSSDVCSSDLRTAKNIARGFEKVTVEGLLLKGIIEAKNKDRKSLEGLRKRLMERHDVPGDLIAVDGVKNRLETSGEIACFLAEEHRASGVVYSLVEEYPTADRLEGEKTRL